MDGHELQYKCKVALSSKTNTVHHACSRVMYAMNNIIVHCYCPHIISLAFVVVNSMSYALPEVSNTSKFRTHSVVPIMFALEGPTVYMYVIPALTCSRSPIQYHSFGRFDTHLFIVLRMSQGQFYRLLQGQVEEMHV